MPDELNTANAINGQESAFGNAGLSLETKRSGFESEGVFVNGSKSCRWIVAAFYVHHELAIVKPQLPGGIEFGTVIG